MPETPRLYATPEAAAAIGIAKGYLRMLIAQGIAKPSQRIGTSWVFTIEEIERLRTRPKNKGGRPKKKVIE